MKLKSSRTNTNLMEGFGSNPKTGSSEAPVVNSNTWWSDTAPRLPPTMNKQEAHGPHRSPEDRFLNISIYYLTISLLTSHREGHDPLFENI